MSFPMNQPLYKLLKRKRIGVLMGGRSSEREVSFLSGRGVMASLLRMGFDAVGIDAASNVEKKIATEGVEIAFIALHGRWGEDGTLQGLLEYLNIPYTGSGVHASALAMNKISSKQIFKVNHIPTAPYFTIEVAPGWEKKLPAHPTPDFPLILKPYNEGSSVGCHLVHNRAELIAAVKQESRHYPRLFAERYIRGKELTVGVLELEHGPEALPILELTPKRKFYDYKAKYTKGLTDFIIPAEITNAQTNRVKKLALSVHEVLNCHGYSRTDFILDEKSGIPYVLELNTLPGLTALSDIPAQARAAGLTYDELIFHILCSSLTTKRSMKKAYYED